MGNCFIWYRSVDKLEDPIAGFASLLLLHRTIRNVVRQSSPERPHTLVALEAPYNLAGLEAAVGPTKAAEVGRDLCQAVAAHLRRKFGEAITHRGHGSRCFIAVPAEQADVELALSTFVPIVNDLTAARQLTAPDGSRIRLGDISHPAGATIHGVGLAYATATARPDDQPEHLLGRAEGGLEAQLTHDELLPPDHGVAFRRPDVDSLAALFDGFGASAVAGQ